MLAGLTMTLSGCQLQNSPGSNTGTNVVAASEDDGSTEYIELASLRRLAVPGSRPYDRKLYSDDITPNIVANPKIDAVTGRELSTLSPSARRRQASLPFSRRSVLYNSIIRKYARLNGMNYDFIRAVIFSESSFKVNALGRAGEIGLMQLKPRTARAMGFKGSRNQLYIPENNIKYGIMYLKKAKDRGDGTICGTILKYNAGLYSKRMNPISARYCKKVKIFMRISQHASS